MIPLVKLAGIQIRIHWLGLVLMALSIYLGYGYFMLALLLALIFHESAHMIAARFLGIRIQSVELTPFGGEAIIEDFTLLEPNKEVLVSLAGPISSLGLAAFLYFLPHALEQELILWLLACSLFLGLFNLLPALPMDGGRILRACLSGRIGFRRATQLAAFSGIACAVGLICHGVLYAPAGLNLLWELMVGLVLFWFAVREGRLLTYSFLRCLIHKKAQLNREGFLQSRQLVSSRRTPLQVLLRDTRPQFYLIVVAVDEDHNIVGMYTEAQLIECFMENGPKATLAEC